MSSPLYHSKRGGVEGLYVQPLGIGPSTCNNTCSVRVLSVVPTTSLFHAVGRRLVADLVDGMRRGRTLRTADGILRRVFLDHVAFLGDTPGINAFLDVLGHNGLACCHRCAYRTGNKESFHNYYMSSSVSWHDTTVRRTPHRHDAVRLMRAPKEWLRDCGVLGHYEFGKSFLLQLWDACANVKANVPKTSGGECVVPCVFEPYSASQIAPDHLFSALCRDALNAASRSCSTRTYRVRFERLILRLMDDRRGTRQRHVFDHRRQTMLALTITEMYAISQSAYVAYGATLRWDNTWFCSPAERVHCTSLDAENEGPTLPSVQNLMGHLLKSLAGMIRVLWQHRSMAYKMNGTATELKQAERLKNYSNAFCTYFHHLHLFCTPTPTTVELCVGEDGALKNEAFENSVIQTY